VALATFRLAPYRGLANAVLRRLAREGDGLLAAQDAARLNLPDWLWDSWGAAYGEATARAIALAQGEEPPLDLSVRGDAAAWAGKLGATLLPTGSLRREAGGSVADLPGFAEGAWWVQDTAATLPARLLGDVRDRSVVDLCAAPGGKTAQLAAAGARVIAVDRSPARQRLLKENLTRLGLAAEIVTAEAETWRPATPADGVLLDAPCSATGTLRRHPEIAWIKGPDDVARLAPVQDRLLDAAVAMLKPGGTLVYCTCSLQPQEGPERIEALLARQPSLSRRAITATEIGGLAELLTPQGDLRTLPSHLADQGGMDGFYAARLTRAAVP
jgi:16S rRNA (cytosine967-C5)-methyltransferase